MEWHMARNQRRQGNRLASCETNDRARSVFGHPWLNRQSGWSGVASWPVPRLGQLLSRMHFWQGAEWRHWDRDPPELFYPGQKYRRHCRGNEGFGSDSLEWGWREVAIIWFSTALPVSWTHYLPFYYFCEKRIFVYFRTTILLMSSRHLCHNKLLSTKDRLNKFNVVFRWLRVHLKMEVICSSETLVTTYKKTTIQILIAVETSDLIKLA
jgi:hypothetical protein